MSAVGERLVDHRHAGVPAVAAPQRVDHRRVVGAVAAGLHEDRPRQSEPVLESLELVDARIGRRVGPVGREREPVRGAEHVAVGVARVRAAVTNVGRGGCGERFGIAAIGVLSRRVHVSTPGKTMPSISLRAVRTMPERSATGVPSASSAPRPTASKVPVGCSTTMSRPVAIGAEASTSAPVFRAAALRSPPRPPRARRSRRGSDAG